MRVYGGSKPQTAATSPAFATHWGAEPPGWSRFALARSPRIYPAPYYHPAPHAGYSYAAVQHAMPGWRVDNHSATTAVAQGRMCTGVQAVPKTPPSASSLGCSPLHDRHAHKVKEPHLRLATEPERRPRVCEPFDLKALVDVDQSEFTLRCSEGLHLVRLRPPVSSLCRVPAKGHEAFEKMMP
ncbi:unnamed protein product [Lampetra planeri]